MSDLPTFYNTGTISVVNGSPNVVGVGTAFLGMVAVGDLFNLQGLIVRILTVTDNTNLVLAFNWPGTTAPGVAYEIEIIPPGISLATSVRTLLQTLQNGALNTIAGLTPTNGDILKYSAGAWTNSPIAVNLATLSGAETLTNKIINASNNTISNLTVAMFATSFIDTDSTLSANSDTVVPSQKAAKSYIDNAVTGIYWKHEADAATTTSLPAYTYNNGTSGVGATITGNSNGALTAQDGVTLTANQYLLVLNETSTNAPYNGLYVLTQVGDGSHPYILTRSTDTDIAIEIRGAACFVKAGGTVKGLTQWVNSNSVVPTMGTTAITFGQLAGAGLYSAGTGLTLTGTQFTIDNTVATLAGSQTLTNKTYSFPTLSGTVTAPSGTWTSVGILNIAAIGIGMSPTNSLDITKTTNGVGTAQISNASSGTAAAAAWNVSNGTNIGALKQFGTSFTTSGVTRQDGTIIHATGAGGLTLNTGASQPIYFATNNTEVARFNTTGSFIVGATTSSGRVFGSKIISGDVFRTYFVQVSVPNGGSTNTIGTSTGTSLADMSTFIVSASINGGGGESNYVALVITGDSNVIAQVIELGHADYSGAVYTARVGTCLGASAFAFSPGNSNGFDVTWGNSSGNTVNGNITVTRLA